MPRIFWTRRARQDQKKIAKYIAKESGSRDVAKRFLDSISKRCEIYAAFPEMGERNPDFGEDVRQLIVGNYAVYYSRCRGGILALRALHTGRDAPAAWESE